MYFFLYILHWLKGRTNAWILDWANWVSREDSTLLKQCFMGKPSCKIYATTVPKWIEINIEIYEGRDLKEIHLRARFKGEFC